MGITTGRAKLFIGNFFSYSLMSVLNMAVPLLLLPVITKMMPNISDYGIYSMYTTIIGFGTPLALLGLHEAMFREYFEKDEQGDKDNVLKTTLLLVLISSVFVLILSFLFRKSIARIAFGSMVLSNVIVLSAFGIFIGANTGTLGLPMRLKNQRKVVLITGLMSTLATYGLSILLLNYGFSYLGLIYSSIGVSIVMSIFFYLKYRSLFKTGRYDLHAAKELLIIGIPLMPTFLIYWVYNSMDKVMITNILGTAALGIYAIGAKLSSVSYLVYSGFAGGFNYFKFITMKDDDQVIMNSKILDYSSLITLVVLLIFYPFSKIIFQILFSGDYQLGYIVVPYLMISPLLLMLFQIVGSQFIIVKKSYLVSLTLAAGAVINVVLNYFLILAWGIEGAAIATMVGYLASVLSVSLMAYQNKLLIINPRLYVLCFLFIAYILINRLCFDQVFRMNSFISLIALSICCFLYRIEISRIFVKLRTRNIRDDEK